MEKLKTLKDEFFKPLNDAFYSPTIQQRKSVNISDWDHLTFGVTRSMMHFESGRSFVQKIIDTAMESKLTVSNYFNSQKSKRRLDQVKKVNEILVKNYSSPVDDDPFIGLDCLDGYAIYAADGHYHEHAAHDRHSNGKNYPVGHVFAINLRDQTVTHLDVARPLDKKEHEIKTLKRLGANALRMGEAIGKKVIMVYDRAIVDFEQWYKWKYGSGLYMLTEEKKNMKLQNLGVLEFDKSNSINNGILSDNQVGTSKGTLIRRVVYYDSERNRTFTFITNVFNVPPGIIAFMYKKRWMVEKVYDTFKNYYFESKAWGKTDEAKCQQALFLCITHNLNLMLERRVEDEEGIRDEKIIKKQEQRRIEVIKKIIENSRPLNSLAIKACRSVQRSKQFLRYLNNKISINTYWEDFIKDLRPYMEKYLC